MKQRFNGPVDSVAARDVIYHYHPEGASSVPESQLQAQFQANTGMWCPRCAREMLEILMQEHGFTARELAAAWKADSLKWSPMQHSIEIAVPVVERIFGWAVVFAMGAYFLGLVVPLLMVEERNIGTFLAFAAGSLMYLGTCWLSFRFVVWPHQVAIRVGRVLREKGLKCRRCLV